jgi:hypothetical protein
MSGTRIMILAVCMLAQGCTTDLDASDAVYARHDGKRVLCGLGIDSATIGMDQLEAGMARARDRDEVLILFAHHPGVTIDRERVVDVLARADALGLQFVTFPQLTDQRGAGLELGFDDFSVDAWYGLRDVLRGHPATFFVSNFGELTPDQITELHELAADGHAIEAHGMGHRDAAIYVDEHGLARYLADEIDPDLAAMTAAGFAPSTFAYPYGSRTSEIDAALLKRFTLLRSLSYLDRSVINAAPCPY